MESKKVFHNAKWIIICKVMQSLLQLVIGMFTARYLGPSNYGLINYATSVAAFALPITKLGFDATLVKELVAKPEKEGEILGTALLLSLLSSIICIISVSAFVCLVNANQTMTILVCILYSFSLLFVALELMQYWFQYKLISKYSSIVSLFSYVVVSIYRIVLLVTGKGVYWFAVTNVLDYALISFALFMLYKSEKGQKLSFSLQRAKEMFSRSKYYIFASLMVIIIQSTDHIMVTNMIGEAENGFYSAAITCAGVVQFVYVAIIDSFRPQILQLKKENQEKYEQELSRLYCIIIYLALLQSLAFTIGAKWIVSILYGKEYLSSIPILRVLVWYVAFSFMGAIRNVWILAEEKERYLLPINLIGATINIILNIIFLSLLGTIGASLASLITQFFMNFILGFILNDIKANNKILMKGLNIKYFLVI